MHPTGALLSQECVVMMGEAMCTPLFHNQFRVPTYEDWVDHEADFAPVYDFHRRQLQHLGGASPVIVGCSRPGPTSGAWSRCSPRTPTRASCSPIAIR